MIAERSPTKTAFKMYDVVRLRNDVPDSPLRAGQTGTIVDTVANGAFEVEFADSFGCTIDSRGFVAGELLPVENP